MKTIKSIGLSAVLAASLLFLGCSSDSDSDDNDGTPSVSNTAPVAYAGETQHLKKGTKITLDASGSSDADHDMLTHQWEITTKPDDSTATLSDETASHPTFTADKPGDYEFELQVNDGTNDSKVVTVTHTVTTATKNAHPVAKPYALLSSVKTGDFVRLSGGNSTDAERELLTFKWIMESKPSGSTAKLSNPSSSDPTFKADEDGDYNVSLRVYDATDYSDRIKITITASTSNTDPIAKIDALPIVKTKTEHDSGLVELSAANSSDADSDTLTFKWYFQSIPTDSNATLSDTTIANPKFTADKDGDYVVKLIVNDGTTDSQEKEITITASTDNAKPVANAGLVLNVKTLSTLYNCDGIGSTIAIIKLYKVSNSREHKNI